MLPILYSFRRCPYAIRVRYVLSLLGVNVHLREVVLKSKPKELISLGGRSSVPQLIDVNGDRYQESLDVMFWTLSNTNNISMRDQLWPESVTQRYKIQSWISYNDHFFKYWLDRYKYSDRHLDHSEYFYRGKGEIFLRRLEGRLNNYSHLLGDEVTLADIALFPFVRQFAAVDNKWFESSDYQNVKKWLSHFVDSDVFTLDVMEKFNVWKEGECNVYPRR